MPQLLRAKSERPFTSARSGEAETTERAANAVEKERKAILVERRQCTREAFYLVSSAGAL